ncbi:efflux RND transporter periplasmic adaptor subunit [Fimbriimonadia bacterium ATM]|nr:MAG: efflux RND transporter periplasmic adaptor subunit [Armatimonadota bacterium]MBC6968586.1 efflux RND transporter periplasmic adaptor subunit [Armatimonadota bacterium]MCE7898575.1 efflux RND transporter periplasmic adaptor subunit [Armatimonadetes bacterium ATM1]MDL1928132.1 efflux RND transporter periplasmic adaptor subunit [Fimbriimonadia bacterium ATM]RIJ98302.1 MAG: hypothetical protein DCC45_00615 [Armatimonadota bacterium]
MRTWLILGGIFVLVGVGMFQCLRMRTAAQLQKASEGIQTATVDQGDVVVEVVETGTIEPVQNVEVKSRVSGRLAKLLVEEGDRVAAGQPLAIIDPQELRIQLEQSSAQLQGAESGAARARLSVGLTKAEVKTALDQAEARYIRAKRALDTQPELTRAAIAQAQSNYENAVRAHDLLLGTTQPQERIRLQTEVERATVSYENDKRNYERLVGLLEKGYVPKRQVDDARTQMAVSEAALTRARDEFARLEARQQIEAKNAAEQVRLAKAGLDQAMANANLDKNRQQEFTEAAAALERAKEDYRRIAMDEASAAQAAAGAQQLRGVVADNQRLLGETEIRSPLAGVVTRKLVEPGELVSALSSFSGGTTIVEVGDLASLQVTLAVNEIDVAKLETGMAATIEVDALPGEKLEGTVHRIAPASQADPNAQASTAAVVKYRVEVRLKDKHPKIKPGMSAKCTVRVIDRKNVLRLPIEFVGTDKDGSRFVMVQEPGARGKMPTSKKVKVTVGVASATYVQIVSGVQKGAKVERPPFTGPDRKGMMQFGRE